MRRGGGGREKIDEYTERLLRRKFYRKGGGGIRIKARGKTISFRWRFSSNLLNFLLHGIKFFDEERSLLAF